MSNEIRVSPIAGENVLLVGKWRIEIAPSIDTLECACLWKGEAVRTFKSITEAVEWCQHD